MAINRNIIGIKVDDAADNGKVPAFNSTTKVFDMTTGAGGGASTALDNLASVAINTTLVSDTDNTDALGTTAIAWSDLFLGSGGVITWNSSPSTPDITLTHSADTLTLAGGNLALGANSLTITGSIGATGARVTKLWATDIESTNMPTVGGTAILTSLTAPQFTTIELGHASDTTLSRVSAGVIAVEGVRVITDASTTSGKILKNNGTTFVASTETYAAPGTSGNVMTSDGTNWTSAAPAGGSTPTMRMSSMFETAARFSVAKGGTGVEVWGGSGLDIDTDTTADSYVRITTQPQSNSTVFTGSPTFSCTGYMRTTVASNAGSSFFGLGRITVAGSGHTYTEDHIGFKIIKTGGVMSLYATQADGTTENASAALTTLADSDQFDLIFKINGTSSVDYYWRKNGGALSSATNLTSNIADTATYYAQFSVSNNSTGGNFRTILNGFSYER